MLKKVNNDLKIIIGQKIRKLRTENNLSQEKLAELANIETSFVSQIESGKRNISITTLSSILECFNLNIMSAFDKEINKKLGIREEKIIEINKTIPYLNDEILDSIYTLIKLSKK